MALISSLLSLLSFRWCRLVGIILMMMLVVVVRSDVENNNNNDDDDNNSVEWVWMGGLTSNYLKLHVGLKSSSHWTIQDYKQYLTCRVEWNESSSSSSSSQEEEEENSTNVNVMEFKGRPTTPENEFVWQFHLIDLPHANTKYKFEITWRGTKDVWYEGYFRTPAPAGTPYNFSFAFSSCMDETSDPIPFHHLSQRYFTENNENNESPLLFFAHLGDLHYDDINVEENALQLYRDGYQRALTAPAGHAMLHTLALPTIYMYDDHDFGPNNSDKTAKGRTGALASYREYVPHYPLDTSPGNTLNTKERSGASVHQSFAIGQTYFILTDLRSQRTPNTAQPTPDKTVLGPHQKQWFQTTVEQIALAAESSGTYHTLIWCNTMPWLDDERKWGHFPHEQNELATILQKAASSDKLQIIMISGDAHMIAVDDGTHSKGNIPVLQAAALGRAGSVKGGPYKHGVFPGNSQYGIIHMQDHCLIFEGWNAQTNTMVQSWNSCTRQAFYKNQEFIPPPIIVRKFKRIIKRWRNNTFKQFSKLTTTNFWKNMFLHPTPNNKNNRNVTNEPTNRTEL